MRSGSLLLMVKSLSTGVNMGHCIRTGMCCQRIPLPASPRELRESYEQWQRGYNIEPLMMLGKRARPVDRVYQDIHLIYPMLLGRCLGKLEMGTLSEQIYGTKKQASEEIDGIADCDSSYLKKHPQWTYIYGPCKFFHRAVSDDGTRLLGECSINDIKPWMCESYPNGGAGTFRGCGYNDKKPERGVTFDAFQQLVPLDDSEK